jgi:hypothetical protein
MNGRDGEPGGTRPVAPRDDQNGALPECSAKPCANGAHDGTIPADAPAAANGSGTRDARGRFTRGNPGRPRHRTGAPSANGENGGGTVATAGPVPPPANGRDAGGRFAKGNLGGPGNPFARRVAALRQALLRTVTEQDVQDLAGRLLESARAGDPAAMKLLLAYVLGRPAEVVDPDMLDLKEWQLYQQSLAPAEEVHGMLHKIPPEFGLVVLRTVLPGLAATLGSGLLEVMAEDKGKPAAARGKGPRRGRPRHRTGAPSANGENGELRGERTESVTHPSPAESATGPMLNECRFREDCAVTRPAEPDFA